MRYLPVLVTLPLILGVIAGAAPQTDARTLSFEDAARINAQIAAELCFAPNARSQTIVDGFRAAGFSETVQRSQQNSDTTHTFRAPADTVVVEVYYGEMPESCAVTTYALNVEQASAILDQVVPRLYPTFLRKVVRGGLSPVTGLQVECVSFEDPANPIGLYISTRSAQTSACVDDGTSVLFSSYQV